MITAHHQPIYQALQPVLLAAQENVYATARFISILHLALFVHSVVCIYYFFYPGEHNRSGYMLFNLLFAAGFYAYALHFLVSHKSYYPGFANLSDAECLKRYFLPADPVEIIKKLIVVAVVLDIVYLIRHARDYFYDM